MSFLFLSKLYLFKIEDKLNSVESEENKITFNTYLTKINNLLDSNGEFLNELNQNLDKNN